MKNLLSVSIILLCLTMLHAHAGDHHAEPQHIEIHPHHAEPQHAGSHHAEPQRTESHNSEPRQASSIPSVVANLTDANFDNFVQQGKGSFPWFIMFYAPWCPHCNRLKPTWEQVAGELSGKVNVGYVDCDESPIVKNRLSIGGFPTLVYFHENLMYEYSGFRNLGNFTHFALHGYKEVEAEEIPKEGSFFRPIFKTLYKSYKRLRDMSITNPLQAGLIIGGIALFLILSCVCSSVMIWKMSKEAAAPRPLKKRVEDDPIGDTDAINAANYKKDQ